MKGISFGDVHSYYDLNLILSDCSISPATPKENYINIPGADGSIDLTEALGSVNYNDRTGKIVFSVLPSDDFEEKKSEVANFLNGQKFKITLDKDPDWYYIGRCSINDHKCDKRIGQISIDLKLQPWKLKQETTVVSATRSQFLDPQTVILTNAYKPTIPTITALPTTGEIELTFGEFVWNLKRGIHTIPEFTLKKGKNVVVVGGDANGTIIFEYQEGSL